MIQPITLAQVGQMMVEDYGCTVDHGFDQARLLMDRLEKRGLQIIKGDWVVPEVVVVHDGKPQPKTPDDRWMSLAEKVTQDTMGRHPWLSPELK